MSEKTPFRLITGTYSLFSGILALYSLFSNAIMAALSFFFLAYFVAYIGDWINCNPEAP